MAKIGPNEPPKLAEYDVFLSFRGLDTRKTFADYLYHDLIGAGVRVFRDDEELYKGKEIATQLPRAIGNSRICIPIFSKNYAASAWCLRELAHMVECRRNSMGALEILPIFYDVEVSDVKLRTGSAYTVQVDEHKARFEEEVILQWKNALMEVAKIKGWDVNSARGHGELVKSIVGDIVVKLNRKYRNLPARLVGLQDQVTELMKLVDVDSEGVRFIVIHGMGGIGKTTLAKAVFNQLCSNYEGSSFLENVGERTKHHGLLELQKKLLFDILNHDFAKDVRDIHDGINMIRGRLCFRKALIVIDDVDEDNQLKNLAGRSNWFGSGSRIIMTTRDRGVITTGEEANAYKYHEVKQMVFDNALHLFSWHAFGKDCPPHDYDGISRNIVSSMAGLPLALEVVGSLLSCKCLGSCACMEIWKDTLNKLRMVPNRKVEETLMISINKLDVNEKKVFLDIACCLINEHKTNAIYMWSACEVSPHLVINSLIQKSLMKIGDDDTFWMHDQLRDLGRDIVCRENSHTLRRISRVWTDQEAEKIINNKQGKEQVEVLLLGSGNFILTYDALAKLGNLRFLKLRGGQFKRDLKRLFKRHSQNLLPNLRWLCWYNLPLNFKMANFCLSNLVVLELCNSSITEYWEGWRQLKPANQLKVLDLRRCERLKRTPDFSSFLLLERLTLEGCHNLVEIDHSIGKLEKLTYLNMNGCAIRELPEEIGLLTSLTTIIMRGHGQKFLLPYSVGNLTSLTSLEIRDVSIVELPESIGGLTNLKQLVLKNCALLKRLPDSIGNLKSVVELDISGSKDIIELPDSIENLKSLKVINISESGIRGLPATIGLFKSLEEIQARDCSELKGEIPMEIGGLSSLKIMDLWNCKICGIPKSIGDLSHLKALHTSLSSEWEIIDLWWICKLFELERLSIGSAYVTPLKLPSGLRSLWIEDLTFNLETPPDDGLSLAAAIPCLEQLQMLRNLWLRSCNLCDLNGLHHLRNLRKLYIVHYNKGFPDLSNLRNLILLYLSECDGLIEIQGLGELQLLEHLIIRKCNSLDTLDGLSNLINLKRLSIEKCDKLRVVQGLHKLTSLVVLGIWFCRSLETLSDISLFDSQLIYIAIDCPMVPKQIRGSWDKDIIPSFYDF